MQTYIMHVYNVDTNGQRIFLSITKKHYMERIEGFEKNLR
jgi:hypothetical protein